MTTMTHTQTVRGADMLEAARRFGPSFAQHTAAHDIDGSFVADTYSVLAEAGYLAAPVPEDLGGGGATISQVSWAQSELARHCSSSALATSMHLHVVLATAWRWRRGLPGAEPMLRAVADGMIVASTGGGDFTYPTGVARKVDGGWRVSGRKSFVSGAPAARVASMWAATEDGEAISFGAPMSDPAVTIVPVWDAPGMRGTASEDLVLEDLFVPDEKVTGKRNPGEFAPVLAVIASHALPVIAATYLGTAIGARDSAVERLGRSSAASDPGLRRRIGLIDSHLATARWTLEGALRDLGDDPEPTPDTFRTGTMAKRIVIEEARAAADIAMDALGGRAYRRGDPVERAWRDLRAGTFHPLDHEVTLRVAGDIAFGRGITLT